MAFAAVLIAQNRRGLLLGGDQRGGLRLNHRQRVTLGTVWAFGAILAVAAAFETLAARTVVAVTAILALGAGAIIARAIVARTFITWALVTRPFVPRSVVPRSVVTGPVVTGTIVAIAVIAVAVAALEAVVPRAVIPIARTVVALTVLAVVTVAPALAARLLAFAFAAFVVFSRLAGCCFSFCRRLGAALVLEVDVEAAGIGIAAENLGGGLGRLHGAHGAEVVLGVLQVILGQHAVAGRGRVPGELLVLFENVLGVAAHLHAVRAIGVEGPVRVLLLRLAAAATAIAAALALHTLKISHSLCPPPPRSSPVCARSILSP